MKVEQYLELGRDSIILLAAKEINDRASEEAKSDLLSVLDDHPADPINIYDHLGYYRIESDNEDVFYGFKIKKARGEIFDEFHEHLETDPDDEDELFKEIK